jgi:hypothetical protein
VVAEGRCLALLNRGKAPSAKKETQGTKRRRSRKSGELSREFEQMEAAIEEAASAVRSSHGSRVSGCRWAPSVLGELTSTNEPSIVFCFLTAVS